LPLLDSQAMRARCRDPGACIPGEALVQVTVMRVPPGAGARVELRAVLGAEDEPAVGLHGVEDAPRRVRVAAGQGHVDMDPAPGAQVELVHHELHARDGVVPLPVLLRVGPGIPELLGRRVEHALHGQAGS
jgi:hypothetical protein